LGLSCADPNHRPVRGTIAGEILVLDMIKKSVAVLFVIVMMVLGLGYLNDFRKTRMDLNAIDNFHIYKAIGEALVNNKDSIKNRLHFVPFDSLRVLPVSTVFGASPGYFAEHILPLISDISGMKEVLPLCRDSLKAIQQIEFMNSNTVVFEIESYDGFFVLPSTIHYIIYDPGHGFEQMYSASNRKTIRSTRLDKNWSYVIQKVYWDD
jgi:hypothetical protein